ncbi:MULTISPECIES: arsenical pump-driving ATPase [Halobacterium]|uniref:Putative arsenical pump-driving ATPase n=5 Tax=Halobacterium salinarum TaxID=2242 RepID=ARSA_HALSA|nr:MULTISPECIES: arsenical pump-driving ATPase [Halobacterium]O52027.1 RecName: Full=Putative arsenical pump-driving ATPase; AltName: Full=Arsenical resistance ATPase; AltName: Full=Arsenite-translocating ATPase; AltName: Full=Arsenite-transporting ATPase [Halobacterium salinarum NRC-1]AAC82907.1 ArsA [Halobacterium salinarum NRC-1]MBB6091114.1 arsenite-transporting ATPase [Halobacterium salinarum]MCF2206617.1 TRC40/GET3/ArsA family transport-energizing ATPase [Halobacterium salinarum]MCF22379
MTATQTPAKEVVEPNSEDTEFVFFSGKGGVGKSTVSCATATWLADNDYDTLLVTTDPAPNLSDIFNQDIGHEVTAIDDVPNLSAIEIDPDVAAEEYRQETIEPMRALLGDEEIQTVEEQLNSPCVEEIAAFDNFVDFMDSPEYDVVVFDTAPTGHTIRLMELPSDWNAELEKGGSTCIGPAASMDDKKADYERAIDTLSDESRTSFAFVGKPESSSIDEIERSASDLAELGISSQLLVVNGYLPESVCEDPFFEGKRADEQAVIDRVESTFDQQALATYPLQPGEIAGLELLSDVGGVLYDGEEATVDVDAATRRATNEDTVDFDTFTDADAVAEELVPVEETRYLFFTGKGGVGKSTIASTTAVSLAEAGYETLVVTTDPAAHLADIFEQPVGHEPTSVGQANLDAARIDQERALEEYRTQVLDHVREMYDEKDDTQIDVEAAVANVEEELESPCAEEMAALEKFVSYFEEDGYDIVVFDTAPTGHTLRLLELPSDWKGFMDLGSLTKGAAPANGGKYDEVIETMQDPSRSSFAFVMYPEFTPMMEAYRAAMDLQDQVGIETSVVVANYLLPEDYGDNAFFENRRAQQAEYLEEISERFDVPMMLAPLRQEEPVGLDDLREFGADVTGLDGVGEDDREEVTVS